MRPKDTKRADEIYKMYLAGHLVKNIAAAYGVAFQSIYGILKRHAKPVRPKTNPLPAVIFQNRKYTLRKTGYYACTAKPRELLHRAIWAFHNGRIPAGFEVHHKDENPANNCIGNLELKSATEHGKYHMTKRRANGFKSPTEWRKGESPIGNRSR